MDKLKLQLCKIQGELFELSVVKGYASEAFIRLFMNSDIAKWLDSDYNSMQWMGEEYLLETMEDTYREKLIKDGRGYSCDEMFWMGYTYRYWNLLTREPSKRIYKQADAKTMKVNYLLFHTMDVEMAIENLKEIASQRK